MDHEYNNFLKFFIVILALLILFIVLVLVWY